MEHYKLYINGQFVDSISNKTFNSINPTTEEPWTTIAEAQSKDVNNGSAHFRVSIVDEKLSKENNDV